MTISLRPSHDQKFANAYANMAITFATLAALEEDPGDLLAKGRAAAQKALVLDESLPVAHSALGAIKLHEWDWSGAEREYQRAIQLNPNLAVTHSNFANYLSPMGRTAEAMAENKRAQELDPLRINIKSNEAGILVYARRYDEAIQVQSRPGLRPLAGRSALPGPHTPRRAAAVMSHTYRGL